MDLLPDTNFFNETREFVCENVDHINQLLEKNNNDISLSVLNMNIRSLRKNFDEFLLNFSHLSSKPDLVCLTETRNCNQDIIQSINGYNSTATTNFVNQNSGVVIFYNDRCSDFSSTEITMESATCIVCKFTLLQLL